MNGRVICKSRIVKYFKEPVVLQSRKYFEFFLEELRNTQEKAPE